MNKLNILLVDDKEENLIALEALIRRDDLNLIKTTNPNEALKLAWENDIAIALVDVQMPAMDGFELVELLKANPRTRNILVIFVTAISKESKYAVKGLSTGAVDYLYKPLDPHVTSAKVDAFIQLAQAQRQLIEKNAELENFALEINNSADIICRLDPDTLNIISVNPAIEEVLGLRQEEVIGKSIIDLTEDKEQSVMQYELGRLVESGQEAASFSDRFNNLQQDIQWLECRVKRNNELLLLNMSDITIQKNYTNELIRSRDMAEHTRKMKEGFLASMSHEIRTPINGIIALTHILRETTLSEEQRKILDLVSLSSESLMGVINDILDLSKIEAGKFSIVRNDTDLYHLVRSVCEILRFKAAEKSITLTCEIGENVPQFIFADSLRLNQILMNLLSNALKFTERGGVKLSVVLVGKPETNRAELAFSVEDSGIGIPNDKLGHIFDSFSQAEDNTASKFGGTGLGLAITKQLCELKGGKLSVSSILGKGSVFTFVNAFTVLENKVSELKEKYEVIVPFEKPVRVLMAEDNSINQFAARNILKKWNVEMDIADTGEIAFDLMGQNEYDLVLMDIYMPGMDGYETTRKIRSEMPDGKKNIPIIALSAAVLEEEISGARKAGVDDVVSKPFNPNVLYSKMKQLLNRDRNA
jgi:PAS domain S-box-containing protein